jgi:hypothetical protein
MGEEKKARIEKKFRGIKKEKLKLAEKSKAEKLLFRPVWDKTDWPLTAI